MNFTAVLSPVTNGVSKDHRWKILMQLPPWYVLYRVVFLFYRLIVNKFLSEVFLHLAALQQAAKKYVEVIWQYYLNSLFE